MFLEIICPSLVPNWYDIIIKFIIIEGSRKEYLTPEEFDDVEAEEIRSKLRANTAPTKGHRKNWNAGSVDIKTHRGEKVKVRAPGK